MKLQIEDWVQRQSVSKEAESLLNEAVICYKASAYKAGMLFSYLFFQTVLKERILSAKKPEDIPLPKWNGAIQNLLDDESWDTEVTECVKRSSPFVFFSVTEDLRQQVAYWKNRRNDCAHAKNNSIQASHVESFWSFLQSNLPKFVVNGGKAALFEKIKVHFNRQLTPKGVDPSYIIQEIPLAILEKDYKEFCSELDVILQEADPFYYYNMGNVEIKSFWLKLFSLESVFVMKLIEYLKENDELFILLLSLDTSKVNYLVGNDQYIRQLWYRSKDYISPQLFVALLRNELIPKDQQKEAICHLIISSQSMSPDDFTADNMALLISKGFLEYFRRIAFIEHNISNFKWANDYKRWMVVWYIEQFGLDEGVVSSLANSFSFGNSPWHLRDALKEMFNNNQSLKSDYVRISDSLGLTSPESLGF